MKKKADKVTFKSAVKTTHCDRDLALFIAHYDKTVFVGFSLAFKSNKKALILHLRLPV